MDLAFVAATLLWLLNRLARRARPTSTIPGYELLPAARFLLPQPARHGEACCADHHAKQGFDHCRPGQAPGPLAGKGGVRINKAGCLDRCASGPVAVVYQAVWYLCGPERPGRIISSHLQHGRVVERLCCPTPSSTVIPRHNAG